MSYFYTHRRGVLFLDVLIGVAVFSIIVTGVVFGMLFSQQGMLKSGDRIRAVFLNNQAVAGVRAIRDRDFSELEEGTFGVSLNDSGMWELSGTGVTTSDRFTTSVTITAINDDRFQVSANTSWSFGQTNEGSTDLTTEITDWHRILEIGNWGLLSLDGAYIDDETPLFNNAIVTADYAFVTSETSDGGAGLYIFDITDTGTPIRVATAFNLGFPGYDLLIVGTHLYVVTGDPGQEIQVYDISSPDIFSSANLSATINIPGTSNARAIAYYNDTLFVAARENTGESEFFAYDVSNLGSIALLDELNDSGASFTDVRLHNGYAYLSSTADTMELRVVDVFDPSDLTFAAGGGYNVPDTPDGTSVIALGGYVLLGRAEGSVTEELSLFDISESPVPPSAPWNAETGERVNALDADPTATYGFAATSHDTQELIVLDMDAFAAGEDPIQKTYNTTTGIGRGVTYDILHDRVFLMTNTAVVILKPS